MVKIRLVRLGTRNKPFYRIIAIDEREKGSGVPLEIIGFWHPSQDKIELDIKKINNWVGKGAQVSPAVKKLIENKTK